MPFTSLVKSIKIRRVATYETSASSRQLWTRFLQHLVEFHNQTHLYPEPHDPRQKSFFLTSQVNLRTAMKKEKCENEKPVRLPSAPAPPERHKGKTSKDGAQIIVKHSLYSLVKAATFSGRSRGKSFSLLGAEDIKSSTRVGSVAPLGNTKEDDYYRNDSP
ncbi:hypothetical protein QBC37DRAFT_409876 [Rhypophila decipiens]|uniref:Uncharacterized protein n=1 Tax=Rhypophila decipiens TaxID=261697 RepID=A0AAN7BDI8_9PEZI|nr:hypothetical protein QBC37DRAFT_409876 [Rhypophila decipiens]